MADLIKKVQLMDELAVTRALTRLSFEIVETTQHPENLILVGVKTRGVPIAKRIQANIRKHSGLEVPICELDITFYRDDLTLVHEDPTLKGVTFPVAVTGKEVVICDDVLYTGRTARAAMEAVFAQGRPGKIKLAVLVDRAHREVPIRPDFVGKNVPTSQKEVIKVRLTETDAITDVVLYEKAE